MNKINKIILIVMLIVGLSSLVTAQTLMDSNEGGDDDTLPIRYLASNNPAFAVNITQNLVTGDNISLELSLNEMSTSYEDKTFNFSLIKFNSSGYPNTTAGFFGNKLIIGSVFPDATGWSGYNISITLNKNTPLGWYGIWAYCVDCAGADQYLVISHDTLSSYHGLPTYASGYLTALNAPWGGQATPDWYDDRQANFRLYAVPVIIPDPALNISHPLNGSTFNFGPGIHTYDGWINVTSNYNVSDWVINDSRWKLNYTTINRSFFYNSNYTGLVEGKYTINISAQGTSYNISDTTSFNIDLVYPAITINPGNGFDKNNISTENQYDNNLSIDMTFSDDRELYGYILNFTYFNGTEIYSVTNETISAATYNLLKTINTTDWNDKTTYRIELVISDSHNKLEKGYDVPSYLPLYIVKNQNYKTLEFTTRENNQVKIYTSNDAKLTAVRVGDKYEIDTVFYDNSAKKTFYVESEKISYLQDSPWDGHFIIGGVKNANYVDFENDYGRTTVTKINNNLYKIELITNEKNIKFHSIGGVNTLTVDYQWHKGGYTLIQSPNPSYSGQTSSVLLNISRDPLITNIDASLYWNGTLQTGVTKSSNPSYFIFTKLISPIDTKTNINISYHWDVNVTNANQNTSSFSTDNGTQNIYNWGIDDCTVYVTPLMSFQIRDESDNTPVTSNVSFTFDYFILGNSSNRRIYQINKLGDSNYSFCKDPSSLTIIGTMSHIMSAVDYGSRTFNRYDIELKDTFTGYILKSSSSTDDIIFNLIDSSNTPVVDAIFKVYRTINGTYSLIHEAQSDFAGQIVVYLNQLFLYEFTINASGYPFKTFSLQPNNPPYTITLTRESESIFTNSYEGIRFRFRVGDQVLNSIPNLLNITNDFVNISLELEGSGLAEIGINFSGHNYECIPSNCFNSLSSPTGGIVSLQIKINETGRIYTAYYFLKQGTSLRTYVNDGIIHGDSFLNKGIATLIDLVNELKSNLSPNTISVIVAVVNIFVIGASTTIGIVGSALVIPIVGLNIILSFSEVRLIDPNLAIILSIFGMGVYLLSQMKE